MADHTSNNVESTQKITTSTEWRDDEANLYITSELNRAYERLPFSREYEGVLDHCPFKITWTIGPNLPVVWKGGATGLFGDEIAIAGGLWMPGYRNLAYTYNIKAQTYTEISPPPIKTEYTQGAYDGESLYIVGGRTAGRSAMKLHQTGDGRWEWMALPSLPEPEGKGRWLVVASVIPGKWLFFYTGHPTGAPSETAGIPAVTDWRLRLDKPNADWEPMKPYPGGRRNLVIGGVARRKLFVFGGSETDSVMRSIHTDLYKKFGLSAPFNGVPNYRDAYCYNPDTDEWRPIRNLPFPMLAGSAVTLKDRYILLLGSADVRSYRKGKTAEGPFAHPSTSSQFFWRGYGDMVICYDIEEDNYSRVGVMPYGVATCPWVCDGKRVYGFGGEPAHGYSMNTENVLQIGTIHENI